MAIAQLKLPFWAELPEDCIEEIVAFISFEIYLYFFRRKAPLKYYNFLEHTYYWSLQITDIDVCRVAFNWIQRTQANRGLLLHGLDSSVFVRAAVRGDMEIFQKLCFSLAFSRKQLLILYTRKMVDTFCRHGKLKMLEWWYEFCMRFDIAFRYSEDALDFASQHEYDQILGWWESMYASKHVAMLKYSKNALDKCFSVKILDWWLHMYIEFNLPLKYSTKAIDTSLDCGILNWWLHCQENFDIRMKYSKWSIINASTYDNIPILEWWLYKVRELYPHVALKFDECAIDFACSRGHLNILIWWSNFSKETKIPMLYSSEAVDLASENGHVHILEWWGNHQKQFAFKYTGKAINCASRNGHLHVLDWWFYKFHLHYKNPLLYTIDAIEDALQKDRDDVIRWWAKIARLYNLRFF